MSPLTQPEPTRRAEAMEPLPYVVTGAHRETYDAVMDIVKTHLGAYGIGVEYAYTMVHGAPATIFPEYVIPSALTGAHK